MVVHRRSNHDAWCLRIVKACYYAFIGKFLIMILIWWLWGRILDDQRSDRLYFWWNYILSPAIAEFGVTAFVHQWMRKRWGTLQVRRYVLLFMLVFFCVFLTLVYRVVAVLLCTFILPIVVSTIFSDWKILRNISAASFVLVPSCVVLVHHAAGREEMIWIEMWTALALLLGAYLLARILIQFNRDNLESLRASYESQADMEEMLRRDLFTGLFNRSVFARILPQMIEKCRKEKIPLTLALLDLDDFKQLNDSFGHAYGDEVLLLLSEILLRQEKYGVLAFRYGGEEFALLFEDLSKEKVMQICESMQQQLMEECQKRYNCQITFSCGLASLTPDIKDGNELFCLADRAMYEAKIGGKNKIMFSEEIICQ